MISMVHLDGSEGMPLWEKFNFGLIKMAIWCNLGIVIVIPAP